MAEKEIWKVYSPGYTHPEIQNECLQFMSLTILQEISEHIQNSVYYTIMANESILRIKKSLLSVYAGLTTTS